MARRIIALVLLFMLLMPLVQMKTGFLNSKGLSGYAISGKKDTLNYRNWIEGKYQGSIGPWFNDSIGFKSDLVRLHNQFDWTLFGLPHANKIVSGKDGYLFGEQYLTAWQGRDYKGTGYITYYVNQIKTVQDWLLKEKNIRLLVVFAPDKGTFYPEKIPDRYLQKKKSLTNYAWYIGRCKAAGVNYIDFNAWFAKMKDTSRYVLYPKTGIHWSLYGALLAADSLSHYLHAAFGMNVPRVVFDSLRTTYKPDGDDDDIGRALNLALPIKYPAMVYPYFRFTKVPEGSRPRALFVGDSFYWQWYNQKVITTFFANNDFWYYNKDVYPATFTKYMSVWDIKYLDTVFSQNLIVLLQTNAAYGDVGYGIVQQVWNHIQKNNK